MTKRRALVIPLISLVMAVALIGFAAPAYADGGDFSLDFVAAGPYTYDHDTGLGGTYDDRTISKTEGVVESLEGGDFSCGDKVVYLTAITVDSGASGEQDIELDVGFLAEPTGQPGVGHVDLLSASPNTGDDQGFAGQWQDTTASIKPNTEHVDESGPQNELVATVVVENLDPGEVFILRMVTLLGCLFDGDPTGNLQAAIHAARVIAPEADAVPVGDQTIPFKKIENISQPASVSVSVGPCPAPGSPTRPVTVAINPPNSATLTVTGPGGPYVVTGDGDTLNLAPGNYSWTAVAALGFFLDGPSSGNFTVGTCPKIPASVDVEVGACPAPGSPTVPVTVTIDGPVTVTISGPGGPYVVTETDTLDLPPGDYTWTAEVPDTHELEADSGEFTVQECPAIEASVLVTVGPCPNDKSPTRPVDVAISPEGGADVTVTGPNGYNAVVTGAGETLDLGPGTYSWSAVANETFSLIGAMEGTFKVAGCIVEVLPKTILPSTGSAGLTGYALVGAMLLLLGAAMVAGSYAPVGAASRMVVLDRLRRRSNWTAPAGSVMALIPSKRRDRPPMVR